jgi:hypothetical protein
MSDSYEADLGDDLDDEVDPAEDELDEPDEVEEPDEEVEDLEEDDESPVAAKPQRKPFNQRVEEVAERIAAKKVAEIEARILAQPKAPSPESVAARQARLDEMDPMERRLFLLEEDRNNERFATNERLDKLSFQTLCATDPVAAKYKDDVERELSALRARGSNVDRDTMLTHVIGMKMRANATRATSRTKKTAQVNRERQTARPGNARGDVPATDRRAAGSKAARDKRLENMEI